MTPTAKTTTVKVCGFTVTKHTSSGVKTLRCQVVHERMDAPEEAPNVTSLLGRLTEKQSTEIDKLAFLKESAVLDNLHD